MWGRGARRAADPAHWVGRFRRPPASIGRVTDARTAEIGFIGGVGQRIDLEDEQELDLPTPYGPTSTPVRTGVLGGKRVAVLVRRGLDDVLQPANVPYRANVWALASLGIGALVTTAASGGLRESFAPGLFVVPDQVIDRTEGRDATFYDEGPAVQLSFPDPYESTLRGLAVEALARQHVRYRDFGCVVVNQGPRYSTRAESRWHAAMGGDLVNSTAMPEAILAQELNVPVVNISFVTDSDAGVGSEHADAVTAEMVQRRITRARPVLLDTVTDLFRTIPAGFRRSTGAPAQAVAEVLARRPR